MSALHPNAGNDDFNTPAEAWELMAQFVNVKEKTVWCPFYNDGAITCNYPKIIHQNRDFFSYEPSKYHMVIDNPPYSIKKEVIQKLMENGKPFALLIPLDTILRKFLLTHSKGDFTVIIPKSVYKFKGKHKTITVNTAWFCWNMKLGSPIIWEGHNTAFVPPTIAKPTKSVKKVKRKARVSLRRSPRLKKYKTRSQQKTLQLI